MEKKRDFWDKLLLTFQLLSLIVIPIVLFVVGQNIEKAIKDREIKAKYIEIAVSILNQKPEKKTEPLRDWALDIIQKYSEIKLSKEALNILRSTPLTKTFIVDDKGDMIVDDKGRSIF